MKEAIKELLEKNEHTYYVFKTVFQLIRSEENASEQMELLLFFEEHFDADTNFLSIEIMSENGYSQASNYTSVLSAYAKLLRKQNYSRREYFEKLWNFILTLSRLEEDLKEDDTEGFVAFLLFFVLSSGEFEYFEFSSDITISEEDYSQARQNVKQRKLLPKTRYLQKNGSLDEREKAVFFVEELEKCSLAEKVTILGTLLF